MASIMEKMRKSWILIIMFGLLMLVVSGYSIVCSSCNPSNQMHLPENFDTYEKQWKKVDSLANKGLPRSALNVVDEIQSQASKDKNWPQLVKANLFRIKLIADYEEDFMEKLIAELEAEIPDIGFPASNLKHSIVAELYWRYYQANRYQLLERTTTVRFKPGDLSTWDGKRIVDKAIDHYMKSLQTSDELKKIPLKDYDPIIHKGKGSKEVRPTLYDFIAHRAVDFFMNDETGLHQPASTFRIDDKKFLLPADKFAGIGITTEDTMALGFYAVDIMQDLIKFHLRDKDPEALIDVDLKRLDYVHDKAFVANKDEIYINSLEHLLEKYTGDPASTQVSHSLALFYMAEGQQYNPPEDTSHKWDLKKAVELCDAAIEKYPDSHGAANCRILKGRINEQFLEVTTEYANVPEQPIPALVNYRNLTNLHFRLIEMDPEEDRKLREQYRGDELLREYVTMTPDRKWQTDLPEERDYQRHAVEMAIPALEKGYYVLLAASDDKFEVNKTRVMVWSSFWTTDLSYISQRKKDGSWAFHVLDRESGQPVKNVEVETYYKNYNYSSRGYEFVFWKEFITDQNGFYTTPTVSAQEKARSFYIEFKHKDDRFITDDYFFQSKDYNREKKASLKTHFFTDRAIYRPGQTVYFKGVIIESEGEDHQIKPGHKTKVVFYDVNGQEISTLDLISNKYGSISGSFTAPSGVLTGQMRIADNHGSTYISVEEYKRPTFKVAVNLPEETYKLNENVTLKGKAEAYAGSMIGGARVEYRVVRKPRFPFWRWGWYDIMPFGGASMEIVNGETQTDENGEFSISFRAIPDDDVPMRYDPYFQYEVSATVTDITGEARQGSAIVNVGEKALIAEIHVPELLNRQDENRFGITTTNLNGSLVDSEGTISVYKLKEPDRLITDREWLTPDVFAMDNKEFIEKFPHRPYREENMTDWPIGEKMLETGFKTTDTAMLKIDQLSSWAVGAYKFELNTTDKFGNEIKTERYVTLYDPDSKEVPYKMMNWFTVLTEDVRAGETASFLVGTSAENVKLVYEVLNRDETVLKETFELSDEQKRIDIPVKEEYRGNFSVSVAFVKFNNSYLNSHTFNVPYENKDVEFEWMTFRDKLKPGQEEEWKLKLKNTDGEKIAGEMVATLYDMSLDQYKMHNWNFNVFQHYWNMTSWNVDQAFKNKNSRLYQAPREERFTPFIRKYDDLNWFGFNYYGGYYDIGMTRERLGVPPGQTMQQGIKSADEPMAMDDKQAPAEEEVSEESKPEVKEEPIRRDLKETAFFFPDLETNDEGEIIISFNMPEALTTWKFLGLAHNTELMRGLTQKQVVTQKELMIIPNPPRFLRVGDQLSFTAKVVNMTEKSLSGTARLELFNARNMDPVGDEFGLDKMVVDFSVDGNQSTAVSWEIRAPEFTGALIYRASASSGQFTDAEENALPVLTNQMLVTESLPLPVRGEETKDFRFESLINSGDSKTLRSHKLTLEFTSNPAWYAVQALPYLMEPKFESVDNVFRRYYANSIASHLVNSKPAIKRVFESWKNLTPDALLSNLEKNQDLKSLLLQETPWVLNAQNESERKQRIALLFDLNKMDSELNQTLIRLQQLQTRNGGWPWFEGMPDSWFITQEIVSGMGHLKVLDVQNLKSDPETWSMITRAARYLDQRLKEHYDLIVRDTSVKKGEDHLSQLVIKYLYARSFFKDEVPVLNNSQEAFNYFREQSKIYWSEQSNYMQGMIALALYRLGEKSIPSGIIKSLKERSLHSDELGMYWRDNQPGMYWYDAPVETQALLIEAFDLISGDEKAVREMKVWLLKHKQTNEWNTARSTAEAVYALLLRGTDWLESDQLVEVKLANQTIDPFELEETKVEAGTGYFKTSWHSKEIEPSMGKIEVTKKDKGIAWGALYWQYFEDLDKIEHFETPLQLTKKLFLEKNTPSGPVLEPVDKTELEPGDKVIVRIELRSDRAMDYVHMKDMRAAGFEPLNVLSGYKYRDGLGYYESTKDASTSFFFDHLPKGTYVFEYPLIVMQEGEFSNGVTIIESMYAPEFRAHSEGVRVEVKD